MPLFLKNISLIQKKLKIDWAVDADFMLKFLSVIIIF